MEEKNPKEAVAQQNEEQKPTKKNSFVKKGLEIACYAGAGAVVAHECMTKGSWCKAIYGGSKNLVKKFNKKDEVIEQDRYQDRRDFGGRRQQFKR